jgi:hypothetical protein
VVPNFGYSSGYREKVISDLKKLTVGQEMNYYNVTGAVIKQG